MTMDPEKDNVILVTFRKRSYVQDTKSGERYDIIECKLCDGFHFAVTAESKELICLDCFVFQEEE